MQTQFISAHDQAMMLSLFADIFQAPPRRQVDKSELRLACHAHDRVVGTGMHKHRCDGCGTTWKHANDLPGNVSSEDFHEAHSCPQCGAEQTMKFGDF